MRSQTKTLSRLLLAGILTTLIVPALPAAAAPPSSTNSPGKATRPPRNSVW